MLLVVSRKLLVANMDIQTPKSQPTQTPSHSPVPTPPTERLWDRFRASPAFPVASMVIVAVIILALGFGVVGLIKRSSRSLAIAPVKGPSNVLYKTGGDAELKLNVVDVRYAETYNGQVPLAPGRKFVVVKFEIQNVGKGASAPFTNADMRLITPDGSIMAPGGWSQGFLNYGVGPGDIKKGEVIFDIDERNSQKPLLEFTIAFGQNPGSRANYPLVPK